MYRFCDGKGEGDGERMVAECRGSVDFVNLFRGFLIDRSKNV